MRRWRAAFLAALTASLAVACNTLLGIDALPDDGQDASAPDSSGFGRIGDDDGSLEDGAVSDDSSGDDGGAFDDATDAPIDDAPTTCFPDSGALCTLAPQCGCPVDRTCDWGGGSNVRCFDSGPAPLYGTCPYTNPQYATCEPGLTCVTGVCHEFCEHVDASCGAGRTCANLKAYYGIDYPVCAQTSCDLQDAASCPHVDGSAPVGCAILDVNPVKLDCLRMGTTTTKCSIGVFCAPGYYCDDESDDSGTCDRWCHVGVAGQCDAGKTCSGFSTPLFVNGYTWGTCR